MNDSSPQGAALAHSRHRALVELRRHCCLPIIVFAAAMLLISTAIFPELSARAQSNTTASRTGDLQIGAGFVFAKSNYNFTPINLFGGSLYTTFDIRNHWGGEFNFRHTRASSDSTVYERTYEIGPRIFIARGPLIPYAKLLCGRGVYNFHNNIANIAFNMSPSAAAPTSSSGVPSTSEPTTNIKPGWDFPLQTCTPASSPSALPTIFTNKRLPTGRESNAPSA